MTETLEAIGQKWGVQFRCPPDEPYIAVQKGDNIISWAFHIPWETKAEKGVACIPLLVSHWIRLRGQAEKTQLPFMILCEFEDGVVLWKKFPPVTGMGYPIKFDEAIGTFIAIPASEFKSLELKEKKQ